MKKTTLYEEHQKANGKIVDFHGILLPIKYSGEIEEHLNVRTNIGLFDVSHMGEIEITGPEAFFFCQQITCNDVAILKPGMAQYTALMRKNGTVVDDAIIYKFSDTHFFIVVNATNIEKDFGHMQEHLIKGAVAVNNSNNYDQLALQGPKARKLMAELSEINVSDMPPFNFVKTKIDNCEVLLSTTGYTGEDGFELYFSPEYSAKLWNLLLDKGKKYNLLPIGLGARDTLRLEMGYMLYGNDLDDETTPIEAGLGWIVKLKKGDFFGREVLEKQKEGALNKTLIGLKMLDKGVPRHGYEIFCGDKNIGKITSGTMSPSLKTGVAMAYVKPGMVKPGETVNVQIRSNKLRAEVVKMPFVTHN